MLYCDLETYSTLPISYSLRRYAGAGEVLLFTYAFGDAPVQVWDATAAPMPQELNDALHDPGMPTVWHNGRHFDCPFLEVALGIKIPHTRIIDVMQLAYRAALPGSLDKLCKALKVPLPKHDGSKLINLFCKPRPRTHKLDRATRLTHPQEWKSFIDYAIRDVVAMRQCHRRIPKLNCQPWENDLLLLDAEINDRGIPVDLVMAERTIEAVERTREQLNAELRVLTEGAVSSASQAAVLASWLGLENLTASTVQRALDDQALADTKRRALEIRQKVSGTAVRKYTVMRERADSDGRIRGCYAYCGASRTRRWAGRGFQPQNLPRGSYKGCLDTAIRYLRAGVGDLVLDDCVGAATSAIRGAVWLGGKPMSVSDLSNIEGRVAAWLADEVWKLEAFRANDKGEGPDIYKASYGATFGVSPDSVDKAQRQVGKVLELSMTYNGSYFAFKSFAEIYGLDLHDLAERARPALKPLYVEQAAKFWDWMMEKDPARLEAEDRFTFIHIDAIKRAWRAGHPHITAVWKRYEKAYSAAASGTPSRVGQVQFIPEPWGIRVVLPSGGELAYWSPDGMSYLGTIMPQNVWGRIKTYGGKLLENITQAVSRDLLAVWMLEVQRRGGKIFMHSHDEIVAEGDIDLSAILQDMQIPWAAGLPLRAEGFTCTRYRK